MKPPSPEPVGETPPRRVSVQIPEREMATLDRVARDTGLSRPQVIEYLVSRQSARDLTREIKAAGLTPRLRGRRKTTIFS